MICALIMAGGTGTRFWPLSDEKKPKQFLSLIEDKTMLQATVGRLKTLIPIEQIFIATSYDYVSLVKEQIHDLPEDNIIIEPVRKNTAPCILLSAFYIKNKYKNCVMAVFPSDHLINQEEELLENIQKAHDFIKVDPKAIVTLGIKPTRAETGYGYIEIQDNIFDYGDMKKVIRFVEKPNETLAKQYYNQGNFLWNSGIFIWDLDEIINSGKRFLNNTYNILREIAISDNYHEELKSKYELVENISIDYGIMEHSDNIYVIPSQLGWDDIGTWRAVKRYSKIDENNNIVKGKVKSINSKNNVIFGKEKEVVFLNVNDIYFVETDDRIYIGNKEELDDLNKYKGRV